MRLIRKDKLASFPQIPIDVKQLVKQLSSEIDDKITAWGNTHNLSETAHLPTYFHTGLVDGGTIGAISEALDHLDKTLDGGTF